MRAYFDYNASSPLRPEVVAAMADFFARGGGNPSSAHTEGRRARALVERARDDLATLLRVDPKRVIFTSGATESNNVALRGFHALHPNAEIVTTVIEHHSVLVTAAALESAGAFVRRLGVGTDGQPELHSLGKESVACPRLVSIAAANGETGHVTDLARVRAALQVGDLLHVDAAQAAGRIPLPPGDDFDLMSLSAHKFGGPQGVGALVIPADLSWHPLLTGGPQERALRAGTENLPGVVAMAAAAKACAGSMAAERDRIAALRDRLWDRIEPAIAGLLRITPAHGLHNTLTVAVPDVASDVIVTGLDLAGFAVSAGSACATGSPEPSHVAEALGIGPAHIHGIIRMSLGHATTAGEVDALAAAFASVVGRARQAA